MDADGVAVTDGVVADFKISKNGAAPAALNASATLTHRHTGHYSLALTATDLDTVGSAEVVIDDTVNACPLKAITVIEEAVYDALFAASAAGYGTLDAAGVRTAVGLASANLDTQLADVPTVDEFNARTKPTADYFDWTTDQVIVVTNNDKTGYALTTLPTIPANWLTAAGIAADVTTELQSGLATAAALATLQTSVDNVPTVAEFEARTIAAAIYATAANQTTIIAALGVIDDFLDTEVSAIKAVTDKLDTGLVLDGAVWQWTVNALELGPAGGGGGTADWTATEKEEIRYRLGVSGATSIPTAKPHLADPRVNRAPAPAFTIQIDRTTHRGTAPIRLTPGTVVDIVVFLDLSSVFGRNIFVDTVETPTVSGGSITAAALGVRDTYAAVELAGTATASEEPEVSLAVTMDTGEQITIEFDIEVFAA
jgi:hypothetical protein